MNVEYKNINNLILYKTGSNIIIFDKIIFSSIIDIQKNITISNLSYNFFKISLLSLEFIDFKSILMIFEYGNKFYLGIYDIDKDKMTKYLVFSGLEIENLERVKLTRDLNNLFVLNIDDKQYYDVVIDNGEIRYSKRMLPSLKLNEFYIRLENNMYLFKYENNKLIFSNFWNKLEIEPDDLLQLDNIIDVIDKYIIYQVDDKHRFLDINNLNLYEIEYIFENQKFTNLNIKKL